MTLEEIKREVYLAMENKPQQWRDGQFVFNYIEDYYGDIARKVQFNDHIDCFYDDSVIDKFLEKCIKRINLTLE